MAIEIPTAAPARVRAGDTITWRISHPDYPASDGWSLTYRAINASAKFDITASTDNGTHLVSVTPANSKLWQAGDYQLIAVYSKDSDRVSEPARRITVLPNLADIGATGYDGRTHAKKMLDAIEAALVSFGTGERLAVVSAEVTGRGLKYDFAGLHKLRNIYAAEVRAEEAAERAALGLGSRNKIVVRL